MIAEQSLHQGRLQEALTQLQQQVRKQPGQAKYRVFLFQLLAIMGHWQRALNQLQVVGELDADTLPMAQTYREALRCESLRADVFNGQRLPLIFGDPEQWLALLMEALRSTAAGHYLQAHQLRGQAFEQSPATPGSVDGQPFQWLADGDSRLGPILEAIVNGRYYWIPFQRLAKVRLEEPVDLRDLIWIPAYFTWANGGETVGLIPVRYPGSEALDATGEVDAPLALARETRWIEKEGDTYLGLGQRMLITDAGEYPLLQIREIVFEPAVAGSPEGEAVSG